MLLIDALLDVVFVGPDRRFEEPDVTPTESAACDQPGEERKDELEVRAYAHSAIVKRQWKDLNTVEG